MANLFEYLKWRGDLDFKQAAFNPVDNIIFSQLSYLPFEGIVPGPDEKNAVSIRQAAEAFNEKLENGIIIPETIMFRDDPALLKVLASSNRFGSCLLCGYVNLIDTEREIQFSALGITGCDSGFIAYRGTDANFVGWKEDFNMSFSDVVPAQLEAADYLEKMAAKIKGPLRLGGHSKGGNLAIYAASHCRKKISRRITGIFSNDSPGFHGNVITSEGYMLIKDRIHSFVPQSSIVGMLLEHGNNYTVVKSSQIGLMQHELYSWEVAHNDMIYLENVSKHSRFLDKTLREWIGNLDIVHREQFFEALYSILSASQVKSIPELESSWLKSTGRMIQSLGNIDESTRSLIAKSLAALFRSARNNIDTLLKQEAEI